MKKILITGGAGYIGSILTPHLLEKEYSVTVVDNFMYSENSLNSSCISKNLKIIKADVRDNKIMNKSEYIGVWKSVNDVQFQLGEKFNEFLDYIKNILESEQIVNSQYITKAWVTRKSN